VRELCSGLTLFLRNESQVSARHGSGPRSAEAFKRYIPLWGSMRAEGVLSGRDGENIFLFYSRLLPLQLKLTLGSAFMDMLKFSYGGVNKNIYFYTALSPYPLFNAWR
jgi:hypothetical protein